MKRFLIACLFLLSIQPVFGYDRGENRGERRDRDLYEKNWMRLRAKQQREAVRHRQGYCDPNDPNCYYYRYPRDSYPVYEGH